jgi:hypothetical protein
MALPRHGREMKKEKSKELTYRHKCTLQKIVRQGTCIGPEINCISEECPLNKYTRGRCHGDNKDDYRVKSALKLLQKSKSN